MKKYTSLLSQVSLSDLSHVGGKGANLGELIKAGFPVPAGFCIRAAALEHFFEINRLGAQIAPILAGIDFLNLEQLEAKTGEIRDLIVSSPVPEEITGEILSTYRKLEDGPELPLVAVRSSVGTKYLRRSSFPGQMDTYYGVRGEEELIRHVLRCWASLFTARATLGRHKLELDHFSVFVAPLIQLMVPAEAAGVTFTIHPTTGRSDEMVINASFGLGESVVSGKVCPDQIVVGKEDLGVRSEEIGEKKVKITVDPETGRGSREVSLENGLHREPCLTREQVATLAGLCASIEAHYGLPQDIEWARVGDEFYILQSRKVVMAKTEDTPEIPDEWVSEFDTPIDPRFPEYTSANISEVLPGVLTPFTISGMPALENGFRLPNLEIGLLTLPSDPPEYLFLGFFYGRAHLNITTLRSIAGQIPGASAAEFDRPIPEFEWKVPQPKPGPIQYLRIPILLYRTIKMEKDMPRRVAHWRKEVSERVEMERRMDLAQLPREEVTTRIIEARKEGGEVLGVHIAASQFAVGYFELLRKLTNRWLGDTYGTLAARLVTGLSAIESARPSFAIWELSRDVQGNPDLHELFTATSAEEIGMKLPQMNSESAVRFREKLQKFLKAYGYRSVFEAEVIHPSWEEDPAYVFAMIQNFLSIEPGNDPTGIERRQKQDRESAIQEAESRLSLWQRMIFRKILKRCHTFIPMREEVKALAMMGVNTVKKVCRLFSRDLTGREILKDEQDLYFLTLEEIIPLVIGEEAPPDLYERIERRRDEYRRNHEVELPEFFFGRPQPVLRREKVVDRSVRVLKGIPVSPGRVTGKARVILTPREKATLKPGEILVAPVTDAGWTPLFLVASALVVDIGGLLSHGSIVAREYGIPGVINVREGTRLIRDGDEITVDGNVGEVILHHHE